MFNFEHAKRAGATDIQVARQALTFTAGRADPKWGSIFPRNRAALFKFLKERPQVVLKLKMNELRMFRWTMQQWKVLMDLRPRRENPLKKTVEKLEETKKAHVAEIVELKEKNARLTAEIETLEAKTKCANQSQRRSSACPQEGCAIL